MPVKIRLSRHGKKGSAFYHIVAADSRAPRDGKYIERLGSYNPNTHPATVELNFDKALTWLNNGAQPTETCRNILSSEGVLLKKHLLGGIAKGAFSEEEAESRFQKWLSEKRDKAESLKNNIVKAKDEAGRKRQEAEANAKEAIAKKVAEKLAARDVAATPENEEEAPAAAPAAAAPAAAAPAAKPAAAAPAAEPAAAAPAAEPAAAAPAAE
ncbi:MAG: 30S ribosomal protein S16 [Bacteroidales bacterium]|jgi:small subunit ribosomal protein S16|nr:30S ribosomal protein S16 [Bacteroidales bacterium]